MTRSCFILFEYEHLTAKKFLNRFTATKSDSLKFLHLALVIVPGDVAEREVYHGGRASHVACAAVLGVLGGHGVVILRGKYFSLIILMNIHYFYNFKEIQHLAK